MADEEVPGMFYGVNLSKIPNERVNFPVGIIIDDLVNIKRLSNLVTKYGLDYFINEIGAFNDPKYSIEKVHIGMRINEIEYEFEGEFYKFDKKQTRKLLTNPSWLLNNIKKMGLNITNDYLTLYSYYQT